YDQTVNSISAGASELADRIRELESEVAELKSDNDSLIKMVATLQDDLKDAIEALDNKAASAVKE
ncbi:MAG TPA: hypothetical protein DCZ63_13030, partial [Geobacter sp.]|nr:hypothetical protein [Geobacter sp.]